MIRGSHTFLVKLAIGSLVPSLICVVPDLAPKHEAPAATPPA